MNPADRWSKRAKTHARVLSKSIGPRGATSDGERRAAEYVRDELQRLGLRDVRLESFRGAISIWLPWAIAFSIAAWGMLIGLLFDLVGGLIAAILYLVAAWIAYRELYPSASDRSVRRWLWRQDSQNVLGIVPSVGPAQRQVVLMAYLDSARTPFFWRTSRRRRLAGYLVLPLFFSLLLSAIAFLLAAITTQLIYYLIALVCVFAQAGAVVASLYAEHSPFSSGANNNAAGVGMLLALAERLRETPLTQTAVWVLATGCRETGGDGIRTFLKTHGHALPGATFIALEGVGVGERVIYLTGEGILRHTPYTPKTLALAAQAAARCRSQGGGTLEIAAERHRGGPTEMGLIVRQDFEGVTINVWPDAWPGSAGRRRIDDTFDTITQRALERVHTFVWALLHEIDNGLERQ